MLRANNILCGLTPKEVRKLVYDFISQNPAENESRPILEVQLCDESAGEDYI